MIAARAQLIEWLFLLHWSKIMTSEHLFNGRASQQDFPQKKKSKVDQSGRWSSEGRTAERLASAAFPAPAGGWAHHTCEQEADSRG
jgi:hypothetical protein